MVQRKVPNKLGIQADHDKSEKRLGNLKPVNFQYQDGSRNRGVDLMMMKKSRSTKLSDIESSRSSPLKRNISLPGKPPPPPSPDVPASASIQAKQSMIKTSVGSPNYMKSTSSSKARKEPTQVTPRITQTGSDNDKSPSQKNLRCSKGDSSSGNKPTKTLTRSSSLKLVRNLKKTPSFKLARSSAKKCSKITSCADINAQRATCSSTLKDSKFPSYVMLNPGGTELEGTSVMKVCSYTYCSLNGHFHSPLPPLKCFLSAKRRLLKTQKNMKLEALSPGANESDDGRKEIYTGMVVSDVKPASQEEDLGSSAISPLIRDGSMEFFIEIYARDNCAAAETSGGGVDDVDDQEKNDSTIKVEGFDDLMSSDGGINERTEEYDDEEDAESLSDGSPHSEIDFEENLDQNIEIISTGMNTTEFFYEELKEEDADEDYPSFFAHEESTVQYINNGSDAKEEHSEMGELDKSDSDASDMKWEERQFIASYFDSDGDDKTQTGDKIDLDLRQLSKDGNPDSIKKSNLKSDDDANNCSEEIVVDEVLQEACEDESTGFDSQFGEDDSRPDGMYQDLDKEFSQASDSKREDQITFSKAAFEESTTAEGKDSIVETDEKNSYVVASASTEGPNEELTASSDENNVVWIVGDEIVGIDPQPEDDETNCTTVVADEAFLIDHQENEFQQIYDAPLWHENQTIDQICEHKSFEEYQVDDILEKNRANEVAIDESLLTKIEESEIAPDVTTSDYGLEQQLPHTEIGEAFEESDQLDQSKSMSNMHTSDPSQGFPEDELEDSVGDDTESCEVVQDCQDNGNAEDSELGQNFVDGSLLSVTQEQAFNRKLENHKDVGNQNHSEKDHSKAEKCKSSYSMDSEEQGHSVMHVCSLAESSTGKVDDKEMEDNDMSDAAETCLSANTLTSGRTGNATFNERVNINQEELSTCKNLNGAIRCKIPVMDGDETRNFNPREPNYLPVNPDPEAEKVDLRHQTEDERKNSEEWMLDFALRQAVTKLAPARSRRVALLVEAFETVKPIPKYETNLRHTSAAFTRVRHLQTCT